MAKRGLFVGLVTLDLIYRAEHPPANNQKLVASDYTVSAGGPAANAAVAFSHLGNESTVLAVLGSHPMTHLILADLQQWGVGLYDLAPTHSELPPVSSIIVTEATGERAVISINAVKTQAREEDIPANGLQKVDIVLIDGHQMEAGRAIARQAKAQKIPVVIDAGSWKPGFETVLPFAEYVLCSANFYPPGCHDVGEVVAYLASLEVPHIAVTRGENPIQYWSEDQAGEVKVLAIKPVDTLGAGDIFHGAFCHAILQQPFPNALEQAARVAGHACQFFGTRRWMETAN